MDDMPDSALLGGEAGDSRQPVPFDALIGELVQTARLLLATELVAGMAHDIRQPLASITANVSAAMRMLGTDSDRSVELQEIFRDIRDEGHRADEVFGRIRGILRTHEPERRPFDVNQVVSSVANLMRADAARQHATVQLVLTSGLPAVAGHRLHVQHVLLELLSNAIDAIGDTDPAGRRIVLGTAGTTDGRVQISIADSGRGIPADIGPQIFDRFFTTRSDRLGLGLSIARSVVEAHDGQLRAGNSPSGGAVLLVSLPATT
jgi:signal transduction histidine kinase